MTLPSSPACRAESSEYTVRSGSGVLLRGGDLSVTRGFIDAASPSLTNGAVWTGSIFHSHIEKYE